MNDLNNPTYFAWQAGVRCSLVFYIDQTGRSAANGPAEHLNTEI
jgi:hypothetical protein